MSVELHGAPAVSDDEFAAYIFDALAPERTREIKEMAAGDHEFAAEIELFRKLFRRDVKPPRQTSNAEGP